MVTPHRKQVVTLLGQQLVTLHGRAATIWDCHSMADYDAPVPKSPEVSESDEVGVGAAAPDTKDVAQRPSGEQKSRPVALVAAIAGLIAVAAGVLTPFLPVSTSTASIAWPAGQDLGADSASITAPLVAQTARHEACALTRSLSWRQRAGVDEVGASFRPAR